MEKQYRPTLCTFTQTDYKGKLLYALRTELVNVCDSSDIVPIVIALGNDYGYVKQIAQGLHTRLNMFLCLREEKYVSPIPFFIREGNHIKCEHNTNKPLLYNERYIKRAGYYVDNMFHYLGYKKIEEIFQYEIERRNIIMGEKIGDDWCLPNNLNQLLSSPQRYPTKEIPLEKLLNHR